jgi:hypothetical protein
MFLLPLLLYANLECFGGTMSGGLVGSWEEMTHTKEATVGFTWLVVGR